MSLAELGSLISPPIKYPIIYPLSPHTPITPYILPSSIHLTSPSLGALPIVSLIRTDLVTSWGTYTVPHPRPHTKWERIGVVSHIRAPMWPHTGNIRGMPPRASHGPLCPYIGPMTSPLPLAPYQVHYHALRIRPLV